MDIGAATDGTTTMTRFIALTFLLLGWGFYEASGGAEFGGRAEAALGPAVVVSQEENGPDGGIGRIAGMPAAEARAEPAARPALSVEVVARTHMDFDAPLAPVLTSLPASPVTAAQDAAADLREVAGSRVNMRAGPGTDHGVVTVLVRGTRTEVLEEEGGWARVRTQDGTTGWMAARLLSDG